MSKVKSVLKSTFRLTRNECNDKVMSLEEAIRNNVKSGMKLHIREGASAASREVLKQFWGKTPEFTLIMSVLGNYGLGMILKEGWTG